MFWTASLRRFIFLIAPTTALASEANSTSISFSNYIQASLALAFIVALLIGAAWMTKKISGGQKFGKGNIKIIGGVALSPRERIVLLEVGEEWLVVGIVPGQIRTLHHLQKDPTITSEALDTPKEKSFGQWLQSINERRKND